MTTQNSSDGQYVTWRSLAPIFADVLVSPWNLLVGGLLAHNLPLRAALVSLLAGYLLLAGTMLVYGSLGLNFRKRTYALIEPVFGEKGSNYFFSILLALGQIGWFGVISEIGGTSLATVLRIPSTYGIVLYSALMILMACLKLHQLGVMKAFITASSLTLMFYLFAAKSTTVTLDSILTYQPLAPRSVIWGISAVFSSLISFTSVSPDFLSQVRSRSDAALSVALGVVIPGIAVATLGIVLFYNFPSLQIAALIGGLALPLFGNVFNVFTNTDAAIAIYTPGLAFSHILKITHWLGILIGGIIGTILAIFGIAKNLEIWLTYLSSVYPAIIGLTLAHYYFAPTEPGSIAGRTAINWWAISIVVIAFLFVFLVDLSILSWLSIGLSFALAVLARVFWPVTKAQTQ